MLLTGLENGEEGEGKRVDEEDQDYMTLCTSMWVKGLLSMALCLINTAHRNRELCTEADLLPGSALQAMQGDGSGPFLGLDQMATVQSVP